MKVQGKNVVVFINDGGAWKLYACGTSVTLNVATEMIETSVSGTGKFATFLPTKNSFTGTLEGITTLEESGVLSLRDLRQRQLSQDLLLVKFQRTAGTYTYTDQASFYITSSSDVGGYSDMNLFTIEMQGTGILLIDATPPPVFVPFNYYYGATNLITIYGTPTEPDYVSSVDDVFIGGGAIGFGTALNTGDNITINDFSNITDKVQFLQVPSTELAFTKWSEVGNPLQQNQPIDTSFTGTSVWWTSTRAGQTLYLTRYQTTFAGPIIFSR